MSVDIEYNGSSVATIGAGQMATLSCRGKLMEGDVVISSPESESCEVTYKGNKIANVPMGARVTIHTEGEQMEDDVVIEVVNSILALDSPTISLVGDILTTTDTSGLAEEFDILVDGVVKATINATKKTISFDIKNIETGTVRNYIAEEGMTWGEWIESEYDTYGEFDVNQLGEIWYIGGYNSPVYNQDNTIVKETDVIIEGYLYHRFSSVGSN